METGPSRSPGPAAYDLTSIGLKTVAGKRHQLPTKAGMGTAQRFFSDSSGKSVPGPGQYKLPSSVGGYMPDKRSYPVATFAKGERSSKTAASHSPGPIYLVVPAVGPQVSSQLKSPACYGFGTSSRFQASSEENRHHQEALRLINPKNALKRVGRS